MSADILFPPNETMEGSMAHNHEPESRLIEDDAFRFLLDRAQSNARPTPHFEKNSIPETDLTFTEEERQLALNTMPILIGSD